MKSSHGNLLKELLTGVYTVLIVALACFGLCLAGCDPGADASRTGDIVAAADAVDAEHSGNNGITCISGRNDIA